MNISGQVAIVGYGPTGALLGNLLARRGISCVIVEKQAHAYGLPRAVHFDGETMRVFQSSGLADEIFKDTMIGRGMRFQDNAGNVLVDWPRSQEIGPFGWHESYRFHQPALETVLRRGFESQDGCQVIAGQAVVGFTQNLDGVDLQLDDGRHVLAEYVVGCDGAQSFVRKALGIEYEDLGFNEDWLVVDLLIKNAAADRGDYTIQFCDTDHPATYVRGVGKRRRWEMRVETGQIAPLSESETWQRLARWVSSKDAEIERSAVYTFRSCIAREWRDRRCFLAGDAAHLTPPFMGQGLCAGIRDAANLAWKLAAVLAGGNGRLLDTYASERLPNTREFINLTMDLGRLINQTAAGQAPSVAMKSIWPALGPGLGVRDGLVGTQAPQVKTVSGEWSDDVAGAGFYALVRKDVACSIPVVVGAQDWLAEKGIFGVVVRPDGYIFGGASDANELAQVVAECVLV
ncbi:MAG: 3-(3-hydroxy-phenyl)propionate hydroxylase [Paracoccaceae bacterium]|jgi:3-(3-hydroxy-phenyl)propionate hydroxylase